MEIEFGIKSSQIELAQEFQASLHALQLAFLIADKSSSKGNLFYFFLYPYSLNLFSKQRKVQSQ